MNGKNGMSGIPRTDPKVLALIRKTVEPCPLCGGNAAGHRYFEIASAVHNSTEDQYLEKLIRAGVWKDAEQFQVANALKDIRVWRAVRCGKRISIIPVVLTFEIWSDDFSLEVLSLGAEQTQSLEEFVGGRWQNL